MATDYAAKACMDDETIKALTESEREPACTTLRADHAVTEFARSRETVEALVEGEEDVIAVSAYGLFQRFGDDVLDPDPIFPIHDSNPGIEIATARVRANRVWRGSRRGLVASRT